MTGTEAAPAPELSIVVPAWNEAENLPGCLEALERTFAGTDHEIVIVDDGSTDETLAIARRFAEARPGRVRVLAHERNQGLGAALKTGYGAARGRYVTGCSADFAMGPEDWAPFASALGRADVLVGCRRARAGYNPLMRFNAWLYPKLVLALFGLRLRDVNWMHVYRRELLQDLEVTQKGIPMLTELLVLARDRGATFLEVDCEMRPRVAGTASASRPRVMWRTLVGLLALWHARAHRPRPAEARTPTRPVTAETQRQGDPS